jgi:hypothetical protein
MFFCVDYEFFFFCRRVLKVVWLGGGRGRGGGVVGVLRERGRRRGLVVVRVRVKRDRRVWAVTRRRRQSGGGDRWVSGVDFLFFLFVNWPRRSQNAM